MNFFLMERFIDAIKNGKPIMYYNVEMSREEVEKRFLNTFHENKKSMLNWYKHIGRTNSCNKDLSLDELKLFLLLLRKELVEEKIIQPNKPFKETKGLIATF